MPQEVERKFLLRTEGWRALIVAEDRIAQGYLGENGPVTTRVRVAGDKAWLTIKGPRLAPTTRDEFEYDIPVEEALEMLATLASSAISKTRFTLSSKPGSWTVDVFGGPNAGLVVLEIEGSDVELLDELPEWVGDEVTADVRYSNIALSLTPFESWS